MVERTRAAAGHRAFIRTCDLAQGITRFALPTAALIAGKTCQPEQILNLSETIGRRIAEHHCAYGFHEGINEFATVVASQGPNQNDPAITQQIAGPMALFLSAVDGWKVTLCPALVKGVADRLPVPPNRTLAALFGLSAICNQWRFIRTNARGPFLDFRSKHDINIVGSDACEREIGSLMNLRGSNDAGAASEVFASLLLLSRSIEADKPVLDQMHQSAPAFTNALYWLIAEAKRKP